MFQMKQGESSPLVEAIAEVCIYLIYSRSLHNEVGWPAPFIATFPSQTFTKHSKNYMVPASLLI